MTGLAIGSIKAHDEISEVVVVIAFRTRLLDTFVLVNHSNDRLLFMEGILHSCLDYYESFNGC